MLVRYPMWVPTLERPSAFQQLQERKVLRAAIIPSPSGFLPDEERFDPLDRELLLRLSTEWQLPLETVVVPNQASLFRALKEGKADIALTGPLLQYRPSATVQFSHPW